MVCYFEWLLETLSYITKFPNHFVIFIYNSNSEAHETGMDTVYECEESMDSQYLSSMMHSKILNILRICTYESQREMLCRIEFVNHSSSTTVVRHCWGTQIPQLYAMGV